MQLLCQRQRLGLVQPWPSPLVMQLLRQRQRLGLVHLARTGTCTLLAIAVDTVMQLLGQCQRPSSPIRLARKLLVPCCSLLQLGRRLQEPRTAKPAQVGCIRLLLPLAASEQDRVVWLDIVMVHLDYDRLLLAANTHGAGAHVQHHIAWCELCGSGSGSRSGSGSGSGRLGGGSGFCSLDCE